MAEVRDMMKPHLIPQWRRAWRMFSVQASAVIVAWVALPMDQQEALAGLVGIAPEAVPGILAALAILGRLIDQPKVRQ
jgi:hypothetical protein